MDWLFITPVELPGHMTLSRNRDQVWN